MPIPIPRGLVVVGLSIIAAAAPISIAIAADALGSAFGCEVNEGSSSPCIVGGVDIGGMLTSAFVLGWLSILIMPFAGIGVLVGLIVSALDAKSGSKL